MLKELRKIINRNADHCNKEVETIKRNQSKLDNSISRLNNAEEQIRDVEDRIMEIIQSEHQTESQNIL